MKGMNGTRVTLTGNGEKIQTETARKTDITETDTETKVLPTVKYFASSHWSQDNWCLIIRWP